MALKKTITILSGLVAQDAYHRVEGLQLEGKDIIAFRVRSYKNSDANLPSFQEAAFKCSYDLNGKNPIAQAYEYAKTQEEFLDSQDC